MTYWDSSCVLKLYLQETDSAAWLTLAKNEPSHLYISHLTLSEFNFALYAKEARADIPQGTSDILSAKFQNDITEGIFEVTALTSFIIQRSMKIAQTPSSYPIRTLDGLHLACAIEMGCRQIATADRRLREVATRFGIDVLSI